MAIQLVSDYFGGFVYGPKRAYALLRGHLLGRFGFYSVGIGAVVLSNLCDVLLPKFGQWVVDLAVGAPIPAIFSAESKSRSFDIILAALLVTILVQALARRYWRLYLGQETHRVSAAFKSLIWRYARRLPRYRLETDLNTGALMNVATSDVGNARLNFGWSLIALTDGIFLSVLILVSMLIIDLELALWAFAIIPFFPYATYVLAGREYRQHGIAQEALSRLNELCTQAVSTVKLQRLTQTSDFWNARLLRSADAFRLERLAVVFISLSFMLLLGAVPIFCYVILFYLGTQKVFDGQLTPGELVALQGYIFMLKGPLGEMGFAIAEWQQGMASIERISDVLGQPSEPALSGGEDVRACPGPVYRVEQLSFAFEDGRRLFSDVDFVVEAGGRLGLRGPIGSGKSAVVDILAGFRRQFQGKVELYGQDIRSYRHESLRGILSVVPQKPFLFADTIRNNLLLNRSISEAEIWHWLEIAGMADEVRRFPNGLDTQLGEWGINLSGGQKQRLTLARALVSRPNILLLDDCLSAVDTVTEERILLALDRELRETTLVWVAHRRSTLRFCNHVIEMEA